LNPIAAIGHYQPSAASSVRSTTSCRSKFTGGPRIRCQRARHDITTVTAGFMCARHNAEFEGKGPGRRQSRLCRV